MGEVIVEQKDRAQDAQLNLFQKLSKIRAMSDVAQKSKKGFNYTYADITMILANVTAGMKRYNVSLVPSIVPGTASVIQNVLCATKFTKSGEAYENKTTEMLFSAEMVYKWVNDDNPSETISVPWFVTGSMADCAQAMGAGLTYTLRQFLTSYFQIAQGDDIDAFRSKQREAEVAEETEIAVKITKEIDTLIRQYIADHGDKAEDVKAFVVRYIKSGDYSKIKDPRLAAKLLEDFKNTFLKGNE